MQAITIGGSCAPHMENLANQITSTLPDGSLSCVLTASATVPTHLLKHRTKTHTENHS